MLFSACRSFASLRSSANADSGLAVAGHVSSCLPCLFLPSRRVRQKDTPGDRHEKLQPTQGVASSSSSSSSFPSLSVFSLFLPLSLILFQHSFSTIFHLHLTALIFSLNQSVRKYGNRQSIYLHIPRNKQTNRPYNSFYYSRISLLFGHYRQDSFLLKPAMTEVSNTRLYLGNLPRNGMLAHPSTTTTNTITTVIASS